jgi:hypothetical protein
VRDTAGWYLGFAEREAPGRSPLYAAWASGVAGDAELIALIHELPEVKRQPALVFAVARFLGAPERDFPEFRRWLVDNWPRVRPEASRRLTQTNEPGRLAALLPALARLPGPLALLEVGASAGLCLYPDRYSYSYSSAGSDGLARGHHQRHLDPADGASSVLLECATIGEVPIPTRLPEIVWRAGIDLQPLDAADPEDRRWLDTLVWPEQRARRARLASAAEIVANDPPLLVAGDATDALAGLAAQAPAGATLVLITAGVLVYLPFAERERFTAAARELPGHWLSLEGVAVLPAVERALPPRAGSFVVAVDEHPLAWADPHGLTLEWIGDGPRALPVSPSKPGLVWP